MQTLTFPFGFAVTTALDTHLVGSSTFVKTPTSMRRSISSLNFPFRATGTLRGGMTTGETESSTSRCNFPSILPSPLKMSAKSVNTCPYSERRRELDCCSPAGYCDAGPQEDPFVALHELLLKACSYHPLQQTRRCTFFLSLDYACPLLPFQVLRFAACCKLSATCLFSGSLQFLEDIFWEDIARCTRVNLHSYWCPLYLHNCIDL